MANFVDKLVKRVDDNKARLGETLNQDATTSEKDLQKLVRDHWHALPPVNSRERRSAFAVDGSRAVRHLANGAYVFVAQALIIGEVAGARSEDTDVDVRILPGATAAPFAERFAELMMHRLEASLARAHAAQMPTGSVLFLDGALYGQLPQLYPLGDPGITEREGDLPGAILDHYKNLFRLCAKRKLILVSIAKTSHEAAHAQAWWDAANKSTPMPREISDSELIYRWTERAAGFSTPVLFGRRSFSSGSQAVLLDEVKDAPAIVSFFVRLEAFDDALRIDVPASCLGRPETIGEVERETLIEPAQVQAILELLLADYGGLEVYNALLYSVDREVRLRQDMMDQVYLSLIQDTLGKELRLDRSERRFHSRS